MTTAPEQIVLTVGAPAHGGHCLARLDGQEDGRIVFVRHALPGEKVRAVMRQKSSKVWRADAVDILEASPDRVEPVWAHLQEGPLPGADLAHVSLPAQRTWKRWVVADCLRRIGGEQVTDAVAALGGQGAGVPVEAMPSDAAAEASTKARVREYAGTGTRTRVSVDVGPDGQIGMHDFRSSRVMPLQGLPLAAREINELGLTQRAVWRKIARPGQRLTAVAPSGGDPVVVVGDRVVDGRGRPTDRRRVKEAVDASSLGLGLLEYRVHAQGFWQNHRDAPSVLVDRVVRGALGLADSELRVDRVGVQERRDAPVVCGEGTSTGLRVLELYSGAGLFTLPLARLGAEVISVEASDQAVRDARRNLYQSTAQIHAGRVTPELIRQLGNGGGEGRGTDVVILDPPRKGAGRRIVEAVADLSPQRVVLVACDPAAAARDLATFLTRGYTLTACHALDMFPHTHHVECVCVMTRV